MKSKRTYKLAGLGDAGAVVSASASIAEAAKKLGVERSTVWRWIRSGKVPAPGRVALIAPAPGESPEEWAEKMRQTELALRTLAVEAYRMARDKEVPKAVRLTAMARYQSLVTQLHLEPQPMERGGEPASRAVQTPRRLTHDPRRILQAVK